MAAKPNVSTVIRALALQSISLTRAVGVTKPDQLAENLKAIDVLAKLEKDEATLKEIDELFAVQ